MTKATDIMAEINKRTKKQSVRLASDPSLKVQFVPTGVLPFDYLLGGGLPRGRSVEFFGAPSTLKSYIALSAVARCQEAGGVAAYIDTEHSFDPAWATEIGVNLDDLILQDEAELAEEAADICGMLLRYGVDLIVWDSVAATLPLAEGRDDKGNDKSNMAKNQPARQAEFMSRALRKLNSMNRSTAMLWINQTREKIGITFGDPTSVPGGRALPFYASYRVRLDHAGKVREDSHTYVDGTKKAIKETVAQTMRAQLVKSKLSKPWRDIFFNFQLTDGSVDNVGFLLNIGAEKGIIKQAKKGQAVEWSYGGVKGTGMKRFRTALEKEPQVISQLEADVLGLSKPLPVKKKAVRTKPASSKAEGSGRTPARAAAGSRSTARTKSKSSK